MKFNRHNRMHWIAVAAVTAAALLTLSNAWGQSTGSAAVFEGRPAMAGAQAGQGAMAGPPQGGISPQGSDGARGVELRPPSAVTAPAASPSPAQAGAPAVPRDPGVTPTRPVGEVTPQRERDPGSVDKQNRTASKAKRVAKRTARRARDIDPVR